MNQEQPEVNQAISTVYVCSLNKEDSALPYAHPHSCSEEFKSLTI